MLENAGDCFEIGYFANYAKFPPHFEHTLRSVPNTLLSRAIQVMGAAGATLVLPPCLVLMGEVCRGTMR